MYIAYILILTIHHLTTNKTATDKPGIYQVLTSQSRSFRKPLPEEKVYRVNTGGPLPIGADAVVMVEDTRVYSVFQSEDEEDMSDEEIVVEKGEEKEIEVLVQVAAGENVRKPGSDVVKGDLVIPKHEVITNAGGEIGTIAFVGKQEVFVFVFVINVGELTLS
jgi:gephyrin